MKNLSSFINYKNLFGVLFLLFITTLYGQTPKEVPITSSGNGGWTVPCGVTSIEVEGWGGGGGGGGATVGGFQFTGVARGQGGGGGGYVKRIFAVTEGDIIAYTIGSGGTGGTDGESGNDGGYTAITVNGVEIFAYGGIAGAGRSGNGAATGGGQGGDSANGEDNRTGGSGYGGGSNGGGGGGAAGYGANGGNGTNTSRGLGATGNIMTGHGGNPRPSNNRGDGYNGELYGGGGGGACAGWLGNREGGNGRNGAIRIKYIEPEDSSTPITAINSISASPGLELGCDEDEVTLTATGGNTGSGVSTLWYKGNSCPVFAFIEEFVNFNYTVSNLVQTGGAAGNRGFRTTSIDPMIHMEQVLQSSTQYPLDVSTFRYIVIRYRVVSGAGGNVQMYIKRQNEDLHNQRMVESPLITDGQWHIMNIDMSTNTAWSNSEDEGNVTGWRFDVATQTDTRIELDYLVLSSEEILENTNATDRIITVQPTEETTIYGALRISDQAALCSGYTPHTTCRSVEVKKIGKKFLGSGNWEDPTKWIPNGVPSDIHCVTIPNGSIVTVGESNAKARTLNIESGGNLTISSLGVLAVTNEINNYGTVDSFIVESGGSLLQVNDNAVNTGSLKVVREVTDMQNDFNTVMDYVYWSSPVNDQNLIDFSPNSQYILQYNEATDYFTYVNHINEPSFRVGKGYAYSAENNLPYGYTKDYVFRGEPNNGQKQIVIYRSPDTGSVRHGFNLVGNPYPSNISADLLYELNNNIIDFHFSFWTNASYSPTQQGSDYSGNNYVIYTGTGGIPPTEGEEGEIPDGIISVGQGFLVKKTNFGQNNLVFNNSVRVPLVADFYQKNSSGKDRFWLTLNSKSGALNTALIGYIQGATDGFDNNFDSYVANTSDAIFSVVREHHLGIQGLYYPFEKNDVIPLGVRLAERGQHSIYLRKNEGIFDGSQNIYLRDKHTNTVHNMTTGEPYYFKSDSGEFLDRFEIVFKNPNLTSNPVVQYALNVINIYKQGNQITINSKKDKIITVEVFNMMGRSILRKENVNTKEVQIPIYTFGKQIVIVNVQTETGEIVSKKIVIK